jgi:hypothetical protein
LLLLYFITAGTAVLSIVPHYSGKRCIKDHFGSIAIAAFSLAMRKMAI